MTFRDPFFCCCLLPPPHLTHRLQTPSQEREVPEAVNVSLKVKGPDRNHRSTWHPHQSRLKRNQGAGKRTLLAATAAGTGRAQHRLHLGFIYHAQTRMEGRGASPALPTPLTVLMPIRVEPLFTGLNYLLNLRSPA